MIPNKNPYETKAQEYWWNNLSINHHHPFIPSLEICMVPVSIHDDCYGWFEMSRGDA